MNSVLILGLLLVSIIKTDQKSIRNPEASLDSEWEEFNNKKNSKSYMEKDDLIRRFKWEDNLNKIKYHNKNSNKTYIQEANKFADLTSDEFNSIYNRLKMPIYSKQNDGSKWNKLKSLLATYKTPKSINWTALGAVTQVKDQGTCGSCWSFSTTGAIEGVWFKKYNKLVSLSEQNLIDCSSNRQYGNSGCNGGWMNSAFEYVIRNKGINTEATYTYRGYQSSCKYSKNRIGATISDYVDLPSEDEDSLVHALSTIGPVAAAIDATPLQFYKSGILSDVDCSSTELNHAILITGFGTDMATGKDYYIVKNSWGTSWGENGYFRIARNEYNLCGIATAASYPII